MPEILASSAVAILIASAFVTTAIAAIRNRDIEDKSRQRVLVRVKSRNYPNR